MFDGFTAERIIAAMSIVSAGAFIATAIGAGFAALYTYRMWKVSVVQEQIQRHQIPHDELTDDVRRLIMLFDKYHVLEATYDNKGNYFLSPTNSRSQTYNEEDRLPYMEHQGALAVLLRYDLISSRRENNLSQYYLITKAGKALSHRIKQNII